MLLLRYIAAIYSVFAGYVHVLFPYWEDVKDNAVILKDKKFHGLLI